MLSFSWRQWLQRRQADSQGKRRLLPPSQQVRPRIERLEDRTLLSFTPGPVRQSTLAPDR